MLFSVILHSLLVIITHENWVGVLIAQGWTPGQFKSSRSHREQRKEMKPEDFMDKEDYIVRFSISLSFSS